MFQETGFLFVLGFISLANVSPLEPDVCVCLFVCWKMCICSHTGAHPPTFLDFQSGYCLFLALRAMKVTALAVKVDVIVNVLHFCIYSMHLVGTSQLKSIRGYGLLCR